MSFIKDHWYGLLISMLFIAYLVVFFTGFFSPQTFELCTKQMAEDFANCQGQMWCNFKALLSNMMCEIKTLL